MINASVVPPDGERLTFRGCRLRILAVGNLGADFNFNYCLFTMIFSKYCQYSSAALPAGRRALLFIDIIR